MLSSLFQNSRTKKLVSKMRQSRMKKKQLSKEGEVRREKIAVRTQQLQPDISELSNCGGELLWCCGVVEVGGVADLAPGANNSQDYIRASQPPAASVDKLRQNKNEGNNNTTTVLYNLRSLSQIYYDL